MARSFNLSQTETQHFLTQVSAMNGRSREERAEAVAKLENQGQGGTRILPEDVYSLIADWHHYAILVLLGVRGFSGTLGEISDRLGICVQKVEKAMARLESAKLIERRRNRWIRTVHSAHSLDGIPSTAIRSHHQQILTKAQVALVELPTDIRDFTTLAIPVQPKDLPEFVKMIRRFRRVIENFAVGKPSGSKTEAYCLGVQLFPLSSSRKKV